MTRGYTTSIYVRDEILRKMLELKMRGYTQTQIFSRGVDELYIEEIEEGLDHLIKEQEKKLKSLKALKRIREKGKSREKDMDTFMEEFGYE